MLFPPMVGGKCALWGESFLGLGGKFFPPWGKVWGEIRKIISPHERKCGGKDVSLSPHHGGKISCITKNCTKYGKIALFPPPWGEIRKKVSPHGRKCGGKDEFTFPPWVEVWGERVFSFPPWAEPWGERCESSFPPIVWGEITYPGQVHD